MSNPLKIAFVMPAYNEERLLARTVHGCIDVVDHLAIVDDGSKDRTGEIADQLKAQYGDKIEVIHRPKNGGIGAAMISGLNAVLPNPAFDAVGFIASDAQCDPQLIPVFRRILERHPQIDAAKGSRFLHAATIHRMPRFRYWGNRFVSASMQLILGYWNLSDLLHSYMLVRIEVMRALDLSRIAAGYDFENTIFAELRRVRAKFALIPSPSLYGEEVSKIVVHTQIPKTLRKMGQIWTKRVGEGPAADRLGPLLLAASIPTGGLALPLAIATLKATSPEVRLYDVEADRFMDEGT